MVRESKEKGTGERKRRTNWGTEVRKEKKVDGRVSEIRSEEDHASRNHVPDRSDQLSRAS